MNEMNSLDRENKKSLLRRNIVQSPAEETEDPENDDRLVKYKKKKRVILIGAVCFLAAIGITGYRYMDQYSYTGYKVQWETSMRYTEEKAEAETESQTVAESTAASDETEETGAEETSAAAETVTASKTVGSTGAASFVLFGDNMIKYTKDGASYIDASGKTIWTQSYEMKTPIINVNGDYAVIADQQGNEMYICNKEGCTGTAKTQLPITKAAVSAKGVAAAIVEDSSASYIFYFKKDGDSLGINIKMLLSGDGYPVDIALSPDGKQIAMSVMYMKNGVLKNKVAFYDFSEIGKNVNNRFIAAFEDEFDDKMVGRIRYLNDQTVCAFSDKGITLISVKNVIPDTNVTFIPVDEEIESICYSDKYEALITDSGEVSPYKVYVYNTSGGLVMTVDLDYSYSGAVIDGDRLILYNEESCRVYDMKGHEKFNGQFDYSISMVRTGKNRTNSLITAGSEVMKGIQLR